MLYFSIVLLCSRTDVGNGDILMTIKNWTLYILNGPNPASFCLILFFSFEKHSTNLTINDERVDGVLGTWTQGSRYLLSYGGTPGWHFRNEKVNKLCLSFVTKSFCAPKCEITMCQAFTSNYLLQFPTFVFPLCSDDKLAGWLAGRAEACSLAWWWTIWQRHVVDKNQGTIRW